MVIVSQDKDNIINLDNVKSLWIDDNILDKTNTAFEIYADDEVLGEYATAERAKEVLKEITNEYLKCNITNIFHNYAYVENRAYKMPEK